MLTKRSYVALTLLALGGVVGGWGGTAHAVTLDSLLTGGTLTVGNATYSNFVYGGITDPSTVTVNAVTLSPGVSEIVFGRTDTPWTLQDGNSVVSYHVAFATPITSIGLDFDGTGSGGAFSGVGETANDGVNLPYSLQVFSGVNSTATSTLASPVYALDIVKSIDTYGDPSNESMSATITTVDNTYSTGVPEPASLGVLGLGALGLIRRRRR